MVVSRKCIHKILGSSVVFWFYVRKCRKLYLSGVAQPPDRHDRLALGSGSVAAWRGYLSKFFHERFYTRSPSLHHGSSRNCFLESQVYVCIESDTVQDVGTFIVYDYRFFYLAGRKCSYVFRRLEICVPTRRLENGLLA